jgi:hypothetical protein
VTHSWNRFNVEVSDGMDVAEARRMPVLSGATEATAGRKVVIYKPSASAMTSGLGASRWWTLKFNHCDKWSNGLMGWVSSADTLQQTAVNLRFESAEAAILLCERNGWSYEVAPYTPRKRDADKQYAYNFLAEDVQYRMRASGPRKARWIFDNPRKLGDHFVNYRYTQRGPETWKPASYQGPTAWTGEEWPAAKKSGGEHGHH